MSSKLLNRGYGYCLAVGLLLQFVLSSQLGISKPMLDIKTANSLIVSAIISAKARVTLISALSAVNKRTLPELYQ